MILGGRRGRWLHLIGLVTHGCLCLLAIYQLLLYYWVHRENVVVLLGLDSYLQGWCDTTVHF
jgi:hypothetical protein